MNPKDSGKSKKNVDMNHVEVPRLPLSKKELEELHELEQEAELAKRRRKRARLPAGKKQKPWPHFAGGMRTYEQKLGNRKKK